MAIFDRLLPAWRHSDADVRIAAVRELDDDAQETLAQLARHDADARVRREALRRLNDPDLLVELARGDASEELRALAATRAADLWLERAVSDGPLADCLGALEHLSRPSQRVAVAVRAFHPEVRRAALVRESDEAALAEIARRSEDPTIGLDAVQRVSSAPALRRVAGSGVSVEVALAALDRLDDAEALRALGQDRLAHRPVRKRARVLLESVLDDSHPIRVAERRAEQHALVGEVEALATASDTNRSALALRAAEARWSELAQRGAPDADEEDRFRRACAAARARIEWVARRSASEEKSERAHERERSTREVLCERVDALSGPETPAQLAAATAAWQALGPVDDPHDYDVAARFAAAVERCEHRHQRWLARSEFHAQLAALVRDAEALVETDTPREAARQRAGLEKRWTRIAASPEGVKWLAEERELERRFAAAGEALQQRAESLRADRARQEKEARAQVLALCERLEKQLQAATFKMAAANRALEAYADTLKALRHLPGQERDGLRQRLEHARDEVVRRAAAQATAEEWKLWANADAQRRLIDRAEALLATGDPQKMLADGSELDNEWKLVAAAPRNEARKLWERFRTARNELRRLATAYLAENLARKQALCEAAEALAGSTDWKGTADEFRRLQAEWKEIGPVPQRASAPLFERFRAPANAYFERREAVMRERREHFQERLAQMEALRDGAEQWADSTDWDAAVGEFKRLQAEWHRVAPRRGDLSHPVATAFQGACDRFFERYRRRDDVEAEARDARAESTVADLEALLASAGSAAAPTPDEIARRLRDGLAEWGRRGAISPALEQSLGARIQAACAAIEAACAEDLEAVGLDVSAAVQQREKLCVRLERIVEEFTALAAQPVKEDLGERLRLAMAANTIGGSAAPPRERALRDLVDAAERLRAKWDKGAPIVGARARSLAPRFDAAWARLSELRRTHGIDGRGA